MTTHPMDHFIYVIPYVCNNKLNLEIIPSINEDLEFILNDIVMNSLEEHTFKLKKDKHEVQYHELGNYFIKIDYERLNDE